MVLPLTTTGPEIPPVQLTAISTLLKNQVEQFHHFTVMEVENMRPLLEKLNRTDLLDCRDKRCLTGFGSLLGVELVLTGEITSVGSQFICSAKVSDACNGEVLAASSVTADNDPGLFIRKIPDLLRNLFTTDFSTSCSKYSSGTAIATTGNIEKPGGRMVHVFFRPFFQWEVRQGPERLMNILSILPLLTALAGDVLSCKDDVAAPRRGQADDRAQQRRLARSVGANDGDGLAFVDMERHAERRLEIAVEDVNVLKREQVHRPQSPDRLPERWETP